MLAFAHVHQQKLKWLICCIIITLLCLMGIGFYLINQGEEKYETKIASLVENNRSGQEKWNYYGKFFFSEEVYQ